MSEFLSLVSAIKSEALSRLSNLTDATFKEVFNVSHILNISSDIKALSTTTLLIALSVKPIALSISFK
jgi:hypothetical protein